jgi:uncharacterized protein YkwD
MSKFWRNLILGAMMSAGVLAGQIALAADCIPAIKELPVKADLSKLRQTWLDWNNGLRKKAGLKPYSITEELNLTSTEWSEEAVKKGTIVHKRPGQKVYYDYKRMVSWFKGWGVEFKNVNRATFVENIGWGYYKCPAEGDCTEALTKAIRTTFDFFAKEKGKKYRPHYESLMKKDFRVIGVGLALDTKKHKYYLTVHYGTEITSKPLPVCK